jgi:hypothetical protein
MKQRTTTNQKLQIKKTIVSRLGNVKNHTEIPTTSLVSTLSTVGR